ncbi:MAG: hypothetical protein CMM46_01515 [Rhodospirillaceae bacterium]|nr:hypothetical protein [Rhodospirillaceae bacterium]|tara:strand:- start:1480 stop:1737 length:258 start_codon:yes stop_codon:yes gene_type:complete
MHAIIAAIVAVLLSILLVSVLRKRREAIGAAVLQKGALALAVGGLALIVLGWLGAVMLAWAPWLVWAAVLLYLAATIQRAMKKGA